MQNRVTGSHHALIINENNAFFYRATSAPGGAATSSHSANASASGSAGLMERLTVSQPHLEEANSANTNEVAEIEHFAEQLVGHMAKDHHESSQNTTNSDHTTFHPISEGLQVKFYEINYIKVS